MKLPRSAMLHSFFRPCRLPWCTVKSPSPEADTERGGINCTAIQIPSLAPNTCFNLASGRFLICRQYRIFFVCIYIYVCIFICAYTYVHIYIHTYIYIYTCIRIYTEMYIHIYMYGPRTRNPLKDAGFLEKLVGVLGPHRRL